MLFISSIFIVVFLPVAVSGFYIIQRRFGRTFALAWLVAASLTFYATWNPFDLPILLGLIAANFIFGGVIAKAEGGSRRLWLIAALAFNLLVLGYFKYANFFADNLAQLFGWPLSTGARTAGLPLGISFIAFQKIAYLVDVYQKRIKPAGIFDFSVFASFFPQLVAGPIVHYREIGPQLLREEKNPPIAERLSIGVTIFAIGLFKKIVLADSISPFANNIFNAAADGATLTFFEAWLGTLCYGLQIYFDFSGYSDMAIGLARMFGIDLPMNFFSPYARGHVIEFWRRWHITLSRFLRDYLYIPLGGNRRGQGAPIHQSDNHHDAWRVVARGVLDFRFMGCAARSLSRHQPRLADDLSAGEGAPWRTRHRVAQWNADLHSRDRRLGAVPRQHDYDDSLDLEKYGRSQRHFVAEGLGGLYCTDAMARRSRPALRRCS